jgi:hypothetical protein
MLIMLRFARNPSALILCLLAACVAPVFGQESPLQVGVTGSTPQEDTKNPTFILGTGDVQHLVLEIAEQPRERAYIDEAIAGMPFTVEDMVTVGLLREEEGLYWIDFNLLRVEDQLAILSLSDEMGRDLAESVLEWRAKFEALAAAHDQPHLDAAHFLFIVLGCFALDWDGLELTENKGYRAGAQRTLDGESFTPWAKERGEEVSLEGLYWGSHSEAVNEFTFTTFGDHHSLPRFGLPDMLWRTGEAFGRYPDLPVERRAAARLLSTYLRDALNDIARVMATLRTRDHTQGELAEVTGMEEDKLERIVGLLEGANYVAVEGETIQGRALVLTARDAALVREIVALGREIMITWHEANYAAIRERLADLTPTRNGVPFERVYTEVWHFIFGIANRTLVDQGFFADPYSSERRHRGFLPVIWKNGIEELP